MTPAFSSSDNFVRWTVHPARHQPVRLAIATISLLAVGLGVYILTNHIVLAFFMLICVWAVNFDFFVATEYTLTAEGLTIRQPFVRRFLLWSQFQCHLEPSGLILTHRHNTRKTIGYAPLAKNYDTVQKFLYKLNLL